MDHLIQTFAALSPMNGQWLLHRPLHRKLWGGSRLDLARLTGAQLFLCGVQLFLCPICLTSRLQNVPGWLS